MQPNSGQEPQNADTPDSNISAADQPDAVEEVTDTIDGSGAAEPEVLEQEFASRVEIPETAAAAPVPAAPQLSSEPEVASTPPMPTTAASAPTPSTPTAKPPAPPVAPSAPAPPPVAPSAPAPPPEAKIDAASVGAPAPTPSPTPADTPEAASPTEPDTPAAGGAESAETAPTSSEPTEAAAPGPTPEPSSESATSDESAATESEPAAAPGSTDEAANVEAGEPAEATAETSEQAAPAAVPPAAAATAESTESAVPAETAPAETEASTTSEQEAEPSLAAETAPAATEASTTSAAPAESASAESASAETATPTESASPEPSPVTSEASETEAEVTPADSAAAAETPASADGATPTPTPVPDESGAAAVAAKPSIGDSAPAIGDSAPAIGDKAPAADGAPAAPGAKPPVQKVGAYGFESGQLIDGTITEVNEQEIVLDLEFGRVGVVNRRHLDLPQGESEATALRIGAPLSGAVLLRDDPQGRAVLSHTWARKQQAWAAIEAAQKSNEPIDAKVSAVVKGGLILDMGIRAFMPASHVDLHHVEDLSEYVGKDIQALVVEVDQQNDKVVLSRRAVLRREEKSRVSEFTKSLEVGQTHTGRVVTITDFGAFVDVKGARGLLHMSEMAWHRIERPTDAVQNGQEVEVKIISIKKGGKRIGLSIRELTPDPIETVTAGEVVTGTVTRLADFGAFIMVGEGVEGLCHNTELSEHRIFAPEEVVTPGEEVQVKIVSIDKQRRRVDLSVNQAVQY